MMWYIKKICCVLSFSFIYVGRKSSHCASIVYFYRVEEHSNLIFFSIAQQY